MKKWVFVFAVYAAAAGAAVDVWAESSVAVVRPDAGPPAETAVWDGERVALKAARGEWESFQLVIKSDASRIIGLQIFDLEGPRGKLGAKNIDVYQLRNANGADPLFPVRGSAEVTGTENAVLWFDVYIPPGTFAGTYVGEVVLKWSGGERAVPLEVTAWDFDLSPQRILEVFSSWRADDALALYENKPENVVAPYERLWSDHGVLNAGAELGFKADGVFDAETRTSLVASFDEAEAYRDRILALRAEHVAVVLDAGDALASAASDPLRGRTLGWGAWRFGGSALWTGGAAAAQPLVYAGPEVGAAAPVASVRLKRLRDAAEDYEYLALIAAGGYGVYADELAAGLLPSYGEAPGVTAAALAAAREAAAVTNVKIKWRQGLADNDVRGQVWDDGNEPVPGALVRAGDLVTIADGDGKYLLRYIPRGVPLTAAAPGYITSGAAVAGGGADFYLPRVPRRYIFNDGKAKAKFKASGVEGAKVANDAGRASHPAVVGTLKGGEGELSFAPPLTDWRTFAALAAEVFNGGAAGLRVTLAVEGGPPKEVAFNIPPGKWRACRCDLSALNAPGFELSNVKRVHVVFDGDAGAPVRLGRVWLEAPLKGSQ